MKWWDPGHNKSKLTTDNNLGFQGMKHGMKQECATTDGMEWLATNIIYLNQKIAWDGMTTWHAMQSCNETMAWQAADSFLLFKL